MKSITYSKFCTCSVFSRILFFELKLFNHSWLLNRITQTVDLKPSLHLSFTLRPLQFNIKATEVFPWHISQTFAPRSEKWYINNDKNYRLFKISLSFFLKFFISLVLCFLWLVTLLFLVFELLFSYESVAIKNSILLSGSLKIPTLN